MNIIQCLVIIHLLKCNTYIIKIFSKLTLYSLLLKIDKDEDVTTFARLEYRLPCLIFSKYFVNNGCRLCDIFVLHIRSRLLFE